MALLGMGANVQCNGYFPGFYSTRDPIFESEGRSWTSSNANRELKNDRHAIGSLQVPSPCNLLDYNKELLKQTILRHEAVFRDQIHELHRIYHKQRELMEEFKRNELYKHNSRLEASWSGSSLSSKHVQKNCCWPNLPWSSGQKSLLFAEGGIQLPPGSDQEKGRQICSSPVPTVTNESSKDLRPLESTYRKVGKKILDLQLPADEYIDSDEGQFMENEKVTEVPHLSAYPLNGSSKVMCVSDEKPYGINSNGFAGLNVHFKPEEAVSKSYNFGAPTHHRNYPFYDLSRTTKLGSQTLSNDVVQNLNNSLEACSDNTLLDQKKHEQQSRGSHHCSSHHVSQPWTHRKFTMGTSESSALNQGFASNCLPVSGDGMIRPGISPAELQKTPVSDCGQSSTAFHASPLISTSASFGQSSKSPMKMSALTRNDSHQGVSGKAGTNFGNQNFLLGSSFCSTSKQSDLPSISTNDPYSDDNRDSSDGHELKTYLKGSKDVGAPKNLNLNIMPADCFDTTTFQSIKITSEENKFRGLPWLKEKPVCKEIPSEESKISTQVESVLTNSFNAVGVHGLKLKKIEESDLSTEKTLALHCNEKPPMSSDLQPCHVFSSEVFQNQPKNQRVEAIEKAGVSDAEPARIDVTNSDKQITATLLMMKNEQKKHKSMAGIIDLNSCMIEDENMPMDVDFHAPASPENKECSPPRGESDENQLEMPFQLAGQEDPDVQAEQVRVAAEALLSISGFVAHDGHHLTTVSSSVSYTSNPLHWFAGIASAASDYPENETNNLEEFFPNGMDYFEFMTLNLTETNVSDCCCNTISQPQQVGGSTPPIQPRKGRANRGRWRKNFQSEILPSLASLSRNEVTEDLQIIGSLVAAGSPSEIASLRSAGKNAPTRRRKRSSCTTTTSNNTDLHLKQLTSITGSSTGKRFLISWGKTCKKKRGQRVPTTNPGLF